MTDFDPDSFDADSWAARFMLLSDPNRLRLVAEMHAHPGTTVAALATQAGGEARIMPLARDTEDSLRAILSDAADADVIVTIGGASVGDHDLIGRVAAGMGVDQSFYKVRMRPGKPLMAGRLGGSVLLGLPGNPVSALVCTILFVLPAVRGLLAAHFPREVLGNPGLPLLRLARPGLLLSFPSEGVLGLLGLPEVPAWVLDSALRHEDYSVRTALAARPAGIRQQFLAPDHQRGARGAAASPLTRP